MNLLRKLGLIALSAMALTNISLAQDASSFFATCTTKAEAATAAGKITVVGRDGWLFFAGELRHLGVGQFWGPDAAKVSKATKPEDADPLPVILDFKEQLDKAGVELLLVPVPPKAIIYPDKLTDNMAGDQRLDAHHQAFYKLLAEKGVTVLDLTPVFKTHRLDAAGAMYCRQDTHWSPRACVITAELLAKQIKSRPWFDAVPKHAYVSEEKSVAITGDLLRDLADDKLSKESLPMRFIGVKTDDGLEPVSPSAASPVVLLGDSHCLVFHIGDDMHARGAGLADQMAFELGFPVDLVGVRGSGATPARVNLIRKARSDETYLAGKKLVVWCFSAREFTESTGWRKLPVMK